MTRYGLGTPWWLKAWRRLLGRCPLCARTSSEHISRGYCQAPRRRKA